MKISSGYKTTEFWVAAVPTLLLAIKTLFGIEFEAGPIVDGILGVVAVVNALAYIWSRTTLKNNKMVLESARTGETLPVGGVVPETPTEPPASTPTPDGPGTVGSPA